MRLKVYDKNSKFLGMVGFDHRFIFFGKTDPHLKSLIVRLEESGLPFMDKKSDGNNTIYFERVIGKGDPQSLFALREHLKALGYQVMDYHEETAAELAKLLETFEDCEEKRELLEKLPTLNYAQQTALITELTIES